jgi:hypothetical protein
LERPWTPGDLEQAEDRCHRLGMGDGLTCHWLQLVPRISWWMVCWRARPNGSKFFLVPVGKAWSVSRCRRWSGRVCRWPDAPPTHGSASGQPSCRLTNQL